jgi:predicted ABC-type ATPase
LQWCGKNNSSFTILPEIPDSKEFVNADQIAKGLSPFQPEKVAFEAGRIMLERVNTLLKREYNFEFETTLATKSYKSKLLLAQKNCYTS